MEVADGPAVRDEVSLESPVLSEQLHQSGACAAWFTVCAVVGSHDRLYTGFAYQRLERRHISLRHVLWRSCSVEPVAQGLRSAVDREVLGAGGGLHCLSVPLQTSCEGFAHAGGQIWIFSVCFMATPPPRVAKDIYVRRPHRQSVVDVPVSFCRDDVVSCPGLR